MLHHDCYQADWHAEAESLRTRLAWTECERDRLANKLHRANMALHQARMALAMYELRMVELEDDLWRTQLWCARLNDRNGR